MILPPLVFPACTFVHALLGMHAGYTVHVLLGMHANYTMHARSQFCLPCLQSVDIKCMHEPKFPILNVMYKFFRKIQIRKNMRYLQSLY
jgi:hypothetical protein